MGDAVDADRAEVHSGHCRVTASADDKKVSALGLLEQHLGGMASAYDLLGVDASDAGGNCPAQELG